MKKIAIVFLVLFASLSLTGCYGTKSNGVKKTITESAPTGEVKTTVTEGLTDTMAYQDAVKEHHKAEADRIDAQATAIASLDTAGMPDSTKALLAVQQIQAIQGLKPTVYSGKAPTTGWDVANTVAGETKAIISGAVAWKGLDVLKEAVKGAGDKSVTNVGDQTTASGFNSTKIDQKVNTEAQDDATTRFDPANVASPSATGSNDDQRDTISNPSQAPLIE